jgi:hypothetical protein
MATTGDRTTRGAGKHSGPPVTRVRVPVIGGPCGKPIKLPNSKTKRGWSLMKIRWRFDLFPGQVLPPVIICEEQRYVLREENGKVFYLYHPDLELRAKLRKIAARLVSLRGLPVADRESTPPS